MPGYHGRWYIGWVDRGGRHGAEPAARTAPLGVLFDSQQFNYFVEPGSGPQPEAALDSVRFALAAGHLTVVGSLDVLQELLEAAPRTAPKSSEMARIFFELVRNRILLPLTIRHRGELAKGGVLSEPACYLSRDSRRRVRSLARSGKDVLSG